MVHRHGARGSRDTEDRPDVVGSETVDTTIELWEAVQAQRRADDVYRVYQAVFDDRPDEPQWREKHFDRHCARSGFRLAAAHVDDRLVGVAWGYIGERGQYWPDRVVAALPTDVTDTWVGGHFEFVELAVLADQRGRGFGRRLHDVLLDGVPAERALLSTNAHDSPAVRLYTSHGWRALGLLEPGVQVMGLELPTTEPTS